VDDDPDEAPPAPKRIDAARTDQVSAGSGGHALRNVVLIGIGILLVIAVGVLGFHKGRGKGRAPAEKTAPKTKAEAPKKEAAAKPGAPAPADEMDRPMTVAEWNKWYHDGDAADGSSGMEDWMTAAQGKIKALESENKTLKERLDKLERRMAARDSSREDPMPTEETEPEFEH
jgi:hypothetical protein